MQVFNNVVIGSKSTSKKISVETPEYSGNEGESAMLTSLIGEETITDNVIELTITTTQDGEITIPLVLCAEKAIEDNEAFDYLKVYHAVIISDSDSVTSYELALGTKNNIITYSIFCCSYILS